MLEAASELIAETSEENTLFADTTLEVNTEAGATGFDAEERNLKVGMEDVFVLLRAAIGIDVMLETHRVAGSKLRIHAEVAETQPVELHSGHEREILNLGGTDLGTVLLVSHIHAALSIYKGTTEAEPRPIMIEILY